MMKAIPFQYIKSDDYYSIPVRTTNAVAGSRVATGFQDLKHWCEVATVTFVHAFLGKLKILVYGRTNIQKDPTILYLHLTGPLAYRDIL